MFSYRSRRYSRRTPRRFVAKTRYRPSSTYGFRTRFQDVVNSSLGYYPYQKRTFATTSRRRVKRRKRYYGSKRLTRRREMLGLPPVELKRVTHTTAYTSSQYAAFAAGTWSFRIYPLVVPIGETEETRTSNNITFLPFTFMLTSYQVVSTEVYYRYLMIKVFDKIDITEMIPSSVLQNTGSTATALVSPYLEEEDRLFRFKVLKDKVYIRNTNTPRPTIFRKAFNFTTKNRVEYDPGEVDGTEGKGHIFICCVTSATAASANYTIGSNYIVKFLDM